MLRATLHRPIRLAAILLIASATSCFQLKTTAQAGYTQMAVQGDIALSTTSGSLSGVIDQDFESAFGLGDGSGSPYVRAQVDFGVPVLTVSAFTFRERGSGTLNSQFGNITSGTDVDSDLQFANVKASYAMQFDVGPVAVSPGIAVDLFDLRMRVSDTAGFASETIDVFAPVPMAFLRAEVDLSVVAAVAEVGYIDVPKIDDVKGTFWDAELFAEVRPLPLMHLFAGYRMLHVDGSGVVDAQDFATNLDISGWMIGGGIRF